MDELQLLREFRDAVAPPDPGRLQEARAAMLAGPAREQADGIAPGTRRPGGLGRGHRQWRPAWPRLAIPVIAAAALAAAAIAGVTAGGGPAVPPTTQPSAAAGVLHRAALAALEQPAPQDGQFAQASVLAVQGPGPGTRQFPTVIHEHMWQSVDGTQAGAVRLAPCVLTNQGTGGMLYTAPRWYQNQKKHTGPPPPARHCVLAVRLGKNPPAVTSYAGLRTLPTTANGLLAYIDAHLRPGPNRPRYPLAVFRWGGLQAIVSDNPVLPPRLAAAIFQAAAQLPGTVVDRHVTDAAGRPGIAVAMPSRGLSAEFVFDPTTFRLLGLQEAVTGTGPDAGHDPVGTVEYGLAFLHTSFTRTPPPAADRDGFFNPETSTDFSR